MKNKFWQNLKLTDELGSGSLGTVYKAIDNDGKIYAVKHISLPRNPKEIEQLLKNGLIKEKEDANKYYANIIRKEIEIMKQFNGNPYIIDYFDLFQDNSQDGKKIDFYIKMEYAKVITEQFKNQKVTANEVVKLGIDICEALELCSSINIIHNDIKPSNIFIGNDGIYKLGDFNISLKDNEEVHNFGTPNYVSPEIYNNQEANTSTDLYSLGLVMYRLLNGEIPFKDKNNTEKDAFDLRMSGKPIPIINNLDTNLMQILSKACSFKSDERYKNVSEMKAELKKIENINFENKTISFSNTKLEETLDIYQSDLFNEYDNEIKKERNLLYKIKLIITDKNSYKKLIGPIIGIIIISLLGINFALNRNCNVGYINKNGLCVKGYYYCKNGYTLNKDNKCQKTLETKDAKVTYTCKAGYVLNGEICVSNELKEPQFVYKCADGFTLKGTKCEKIETADAIPTYSCSNKEYTLIGNKCVSGSNREANKTYYCSDSSYILTGTTCKKNVTSTTNATTKYTCDSGGTLKGTVCEYAISPTTSWPFYGTSCSKGTYNYQDRMCHYSESAKISYYCSEGTSDGSGSCKISTTKTETARVKYSCPNGYTLAGSQCIIGNSIDANVKYICADGAELKGKKCYATISTDAVGMYECEAGYVASGAACYKDDFPSAIKKYTCSRVYTLNGDKCEKYDIIEAKAHYND